MTEATLKRLFEIVFSSPILSDELTVLWHAGEPLVPGIDYYQRAFAIISGLNRDKLKLNHCIQSNGILLSRDWIEFFRTHDVKLGISLDGPQRLHDQNRRKRNGRGTYQEVMRAIRLLQAENFPFHVITVLTRESLMAARELFDFYIDSGIDRVAFNIEEIEGGHTHSSLSKETTTDEARAFYDEMFTLVEQDAAQLEVREFVGALEVIMNPEGERYGNPQADPLRIISVSAAGDLSTLSPELLGYAAEPYGEFVFGNVYCTADITSILSDPNFIRVQADVQRGIERCRDECEYFSLCRGGAPANKLFENGTFDCAESMYCRLSKKAVIDVVLGQMERQLRWA